MTSLGYEFSALKILTKCIKKVLKTTQNYNMKNDPKNGKFCYVE